MVDDAAPPVEPDVLGEALRQAGMTVTQPMAQQRTAQRALSVRAPVPTAGTKQTLLVTDANGAVTFHLPTRPTKTAQRLLTAAAPVGATFLIPRQRIEGAAEPTTAGSSTPGGARTLGPINLGQLDVKVLEHSVVTDVGSEFAKLYQQRELKKRPYGLFRVASSNGTFATGQEVTDWTEFSGDVLLFVHGIFSTADDTFHSLPSGTIDKLLARYPQKVYCFNHPTVSFSPADNVQWLLNQIPTSQQLSLDIVAHSRGGLVSRMLAAESDEIAVPANIKVTKVAFAGTPNAGTEIVNVQKWGSLVDRFANMVKFATVEFGDPAAFLAEVLEVFKAAACATAVDLPGLECMTATPLSTLIAGLDSSAISPPQYFGVDTDFRPSEILHHIFNLKKDVIDGYEVVVSHAVFEGVHNDVAVPTDGVDTTVPNGVGATGEALGFPIQDALHFDHRNGVWHCSYFSQNQTAEKLLEWFA
jgi:pimeloyl-ACP methyl ester carboxylesterase